MNFYYFIAQRLGDPRGKSFSGIVTRIALASITLGLAAILISFGILRGFQEKVQEKLFSFSGHMQVTKRGLNNSYEKDPISTQTLLYNNYQDLETVRYLYAYAQKAGILKTEDEIMGVIMKGLGPDYEPDLFRENLIEGSFLEYSKSSYASQILLSKRQADKLTLSVGDSIIMLFVQDPPRFRKLKVQGIYQSGMEEFDENVVIGDLRLVQRLNNWPDSLVGGYEVWVKEFHELDSLAIPEVLDHMSYDMWLESTRDRHLDVFDWLNLLNKNVAIFLGLILLVSSFNMISILLIMIMERVPMIGLMKALGASNWQIRKIFIYKGMLLIVKGMGLGNLLGLGFCALQYYFHLIPLDPENYYMRTVPIDWDWGIILGMNALTFLIISTVLLLPTFIITRIQPVKALRFD